MTLADMVAAVGLLGVVAYGVLGGADFGGGLWDLFATGPRRHEQRAAIAKAMGPVWEANHVWLIFVIVILFTAFPPAFAALSVALFGVFHIVLVGIILRGAAFVFRSPQGLRREAGPWGTVFGAASIVTPMLLGMAVGTISTGEFQVIQGRVDLPSDVPWFSPVSLVIGLLAVALCAYLAAVYLINETQGDLREDFRRRALLAGTFVVGLSNIALPVFYLDAPHLWAGLTSFRAAPVLIGGVCAALLSGLALLRRSYRLTRLSAIVQVTLLLLGWGLAQHPFLIYPDLTLEKAAAPESTLLFVLYATAGGLVVLLPSLWLLFRVFKEKPL